MKKTGIINSEVSAVVANMGHMDWLSIGDAGMPVPFGTKKIDLAVDKELPSFMDVLNNVLKEMKVQKKSRIKIQNNLKILRRHYQMLRLHLCLIVSLRRVLLRRMPLFGQGK